MTEKELLRHTKSLHVLYVEDSLMFRKVGEKLLEGLFERFDIAKDGEDAFAIYQKHYEENDAYHDIVITDIEMPNIDGTRLSRMLFDCNKHQEIIAISSSDDADRLIELINLGVNKFIKKPLEREPLHEAVYDVAQKIFLRRIQAQEQAELLEYNELLKRREEAYLNKLEVFSSALSESSIVSKTDLEGRITYVNEEFCKLSGYSEEELIGHNHSIVSSGEMSHSFYMKLWHTITNKKSLKILFKNRKKNGELYFIQSLIKPIIGADGEIREFIAVAHDVTGLMTSLNNARELKKVKDEFFVNIGHEMRTPLNAILALLPLLKKRLKDDEKAMKMVSMIDNSSQDLHKMIESVLDMQKIKEKTLLLEKAPFDPALVLEDSFKKYARKAAVKQQSFESTIEEMPKNLEGDVPRILKVLDAVVDNAIKFTAENGHISVEASYNAEKAELLCKVKDNGIGIAKEAQGKIFDMSQSDSSATRSHEGAGLGLSIASEIVHLMKGRISVQSELGKGSAFTLVFPLGTC